MHVISYQRLREYAKTHSDSQAALDNWYKVTQKADWSNLIEIQSVFPRLRSSWKFYGF
jgi:mRNA interferase HigB